MPETIYEMSITRGMKICGLLKRVEQRCGGSENGK